MHLITRGLWGALFCGGFLLAQAQAQFVDQFEEAVLLGDGSGFETRLAVETATVEIGEAPGAVPGLETLWGKFKPTEEGFYLLRVEDASDLLRASVYVGEGRESLTLVASGTNSIQFGSSPMVRFHATTDQVYSVSIALEGLAFGSDTKIVMEPLETASHARVETALGLGNSVPQTFGGNLVGAVNGSQVGDLLWWNWTAPSSGTYRITRSQETERLHLVSPERDNSLFTRGSALVDSNGQRFGGLLQMQSGQQVGIGLGSTSHLHSLGEVEATIDRVDWEAADNRSMEQAVDLGTSASVSVGPFVLGAKGFSRGRAGGWWVWTPTFSGNAQFRVTQWTGHLGHAGLSRFDGQRHRGVQVRELSDGTVAANLSVTEGVPELLYIGAKEARTAVGVTFHLSALTAPANDDFENAAELATSDLHAFRIRNDLLATTQNGEPLHGKKSKATSARSQWWRWSPASAGTFEFEVNDHQVSVYQGDTLSTLTSIARGSQDLTFEAMPGEIYYLASAVTIADPYLQFRIGKRHTPVLIEVANATKETAIDLGMSSVPFEGATGAQSSTWWRWTAPSSGIASFRYQGLNSSPRLTVFEGLDQAANQLGSTRGKALAFPVFAGEPYFLRIGAHNERFRGRFHVVTADLPENNTRALAEPISDVRLYAVSWHNFGGESASRWWTWTPEEAGIYELRVASDYRPRVTYTNKLGLRFDAPIAEIREGNYHFPVRAGLVHHLSIEPVEADARSFFGITLRQTDLRPVADEQADAIDLGSAASLKYRGSLIAATTSVDKRVRYRDVWFRWTAPEDGVLLFYNAFSRGEVEARVDRDGSDWFDRRLDDVKAGEVYLLRIGLDVDVSWEETDPTFELDLHFQTRLSVYESWLASEGEALSLTEFAAPKDDPDGDGIINLLELVYGTNPLDYDSGLTTGPQVLSRPSGLILHVEISEAVTQGRLWLPVWLESSRDLVEWHLYQPLEPGVSEVRLPLSDWSWYRLRVGWE